VSSEIEVLGDGTLRGPWRTPYNIAAEAEGSIHNDETARELGLEGGWIAGSIHMEQFVPLFLKRFGPGWFETGGFSVYFKNATLSGQRVRATLFPIVDQFHVSKFVMHDAEDRVVCEGEAWLGERPNETVLKSRMLRFGDDQAGPLLRNLTIGARVSDIPSQIDKVRLARDLQNITEPVPAYDQGVLPPNLAIDTLRAVEQNLLSLPENVVGLYGGIELQLIDGPVCAGTKYVASGKVLELGQTPRTEVLFYESDLFDKGMKIANMIMMSRIMGIVAT